MTALHRTIVIAPRFCGPPDSANGGYCAGIVAAAISGPAKVVLRAPPPLGTALQLAHLNDRSVLADGERELAVATITDPLAAPPDAPDPDRVADAMQRYTGWREHAFPGCFVCGPQRRHGDGLRIFPGAVSASHPALVAAFFLPDASIADATDAIPAQMVWAALDCPNYFALPQPGMRALLGTMRAHIHDTPTIGERCIAYAWAMGSEGRKHRAGSALVGADGRLLGVAETLWIALREHA